MGSSGALSSWYNFVTKFIVVRSIDFLKATCSSLLFCHKVSISIYNSKTKDEFVSTGSTFSPAHSGMWQRSCRKATLMSMISFYSNWISTGWWSLMYRRYKHKKGTWNTARNTEVASESLNSICAQTHAHLVSASLDIWCMQRMNIDLKLKL